MRKFHTLLPKLGPVLFLLIWSSGAIFVKLGLQDASEWSFLALRSVGAFLILFVISACVSKTFWRKRPFTYSLIQMMGVGFVLQFAYQSFFFLSISKGLSPGTLAIILGLQPILTPIISGEKLRFQGYLLLIVGFLGLGLAVFGARRLDQVSYLGLLYGTLSVLSISVGTVWQKRLRADLIQSALIQNLVASVCFLIIVLFVGWDAIATARFLIASSWMILVVSVGGVLLLFYLLSTNSATHVSMLFYLAPIFTILFDYLVFGARISLLTVMGTALVAIAIRLFYKTQ